MFFVVRVKDNLLYERIEERDLPDKAHPEVLIDEIVRLTGNDTAEQYAKSIRRIAVYNAKHGFTMVLLTNNMTLAAGTIADLYKARWDIEGMRSLLRCRDTSNHTGLMRLGVTFDEII